jgi:hypothetical protein
VGSEFASDHLSSDRISDSSKLYLLGSLLAPRFLCQWLAENFCAKFAGSFAGSLGNGDRRRGGVFMHLKMWVLSGAALILWLAPLAGLDKSIRFHKWTQGLSLCAAIGCAIVSGNIARELSEQNDIEEIKTRAITADVVDEIATSAYISQQQRQQEAEQILATDEQIDEQASELNSIKESLELLLNQTSSDSGELAVVNLSPRQREQIELILQCHAKGISGKNKILKEVWGVSAGSSQAYRNAKAEYEYLMPFIKEEEEGG